MSHAGTRAPKLGRTGSAPVAPVRLGLAIVVLVGCLLGACSMGSVAGPSTPVPGGDPDRGKLAVQTYGCGACHVIPDVPGARGAVGPPLTDMADRVLIAGRLPNTADNMIVWVEHPQSVEPGTGMPEMGVTDADAQDIAAFLATLH